MTSAVSVTVVSQPSKANAKPPRPIPAPNSIARLPLSLCRAKSPFFAFCKVHKRLRLKHFLTGLQYTSLNSRLSKHPGMHCSRWLTFSRNLANTMLESQTVVPRWLVLGF